MYLITDLAVRLWEDEHGFIISAELVLIATIAVIGMIVGLSQVQNAVVSELNDVAHAVGSLNQSYYYSGFHARKWNGRTKSRTVGSAFHDHADACDGIGCAIVCDGAVAEGGVISGGGYIGGGVIGSGVYSTGTAISGSAISGGGVVVGGTGVGTSSTTIINGGTAISGRSGGMGIIESGSAAGSGVIVDEGVVLEQGAIINDGTILRGTSQPVIVSDPCLSTSQTILDPDCECLETRQGGTILHAPVMPTPNVIYPQSEVQPRQYKTVVPGVPVEKAPAVQAPVAQPEVKRTVPQPPEPMAP